MKTRKRKDGGEGYDNRYQLTEKERLEAAVTAREGPGVVPGKTRTPYVKKGRRRSQRFLTAKQRELMDAMKAAHAEEKWIGMADICLRLKRAGVVDRAGSTLYVSMRLLKKKLERIDHPLRIHTKKYWGYRLFTREMSARVIAEKEARDG